MTSLPRSTPADQGADASGFDEFVHALASAPEVELHSLMVLRHGHVIAERWWAPYRRQAPHLLYSLSKSFASTALGFAVHEGLVDLDATVLSYFPELDARVTDPRSRAIRVRHVASMASGHETETADRAYELGAGDLVLGMLLIPPDHEPGTHFAYNQPCTSALSAIIQRVSGDSLTAFLRPRLFEPLGIRPYGWWKDPVGRDLGYSGLHLPTEGIAKLGQLYLDKGRWQGTQLLPPSWVDEATRVHVPTAGQNPDWQLGYGFQFWRSRHGYRGDGAYGQYMLVLPDQDAVVAITSQSPDMQGVLDAAWEHLVPALTAGPGNPGPWLGAPQTVPLPPGSLDGQLPEGDFTAAESRKLLLRPGKVTAVDGETEVTAALGAPGEWTVTGPIATAYAWQDGVFTLDVIFVEGPHRLCVSVDAADGTFTAAWQTEPLGHFTLAGLRMPT